MKKRLHLLQLPLLFIGLATKTLARPSQVMADVTQAPPTTDDFDTFNPLRIFNNNMYERYYVRPESLDSPAEIMNRVLSFAFPIAGLILFIMLLWGGFEMLTGAATKKSLDAGRQRITAAVVGFLLLFVSYWIAQIIEVVFGVSIL